MALTLADVPPDKFMIAAPRGQWLSHRQQTNDLIQFRHVQSAFDGKLVGALELRGSGYEIHRHGVKSLGLPEEPQRK